jgi:hypothetical protein
MIDAFFTALWVFAGMSTAACAVTLTLGLIVARRRDRNRRRPPGILPMDSNAVDLNKAARRIRDRLEK